MITHRTVGALRRAWLAFGFVALMGIVIGATASNQASAVPAGETLFGSTAPTLAPTPDSRTVELGVQFKAAVNGQVTGIRFYKNPANKGTHIGSLWTGNTRMASARFTGETASGWQQVNFASPVPVTAGTTYTASYLAPVGQYAVVFNYAWPHVSGDLTGIQGVYRYGGGAPSSVYMSSNYWVDPVFTPAAAQTTSSSSTSTSTTPTTTPTSSTPTTPTGNTLQITSYAGCNGADDTNGIRAALTAMQTGDTLVFPAGVTCRHSGVLHLTTAGVRLIGPGTLLATNDTASEVWIDADNVTLDGAMTLKSNATTRYVAYEQMKLRVGKHTGFTARNITVDGSAAAGIMMSGADHFTLDHVTVKNTQADGIHMTSGSNNGSVTNATVRNTGDDGIAVVSYRGDNATVHNITVTGSSVYANRWGRGMSVVGGTSITYDHNYVEASNAASIYIAQEGSYSTQNVDGVTVTNTDLYRSNTNTAVDHGAVLIYAGEFGYSVRNVTISGITVRDTRASASRNVGVLSNGGTVGGVHLDGFTVTNGPASYFWSNTTGWETSGWTANGALVPPRTG